MGGLSVGTYLLNCTLRHPPKKARMRSMSMSNLELCGNFSTLSSYKTERGWATESLRKHSQEYKDQAKKVFDLP